MNLKPVPPRIALAVVCLVVGGLIGAWSSHRYTVVPIPGGLVKVDGLTGKTWASTATGWKAVGDDPGRDIFDTIKP